VRALLTVIYALNFPDRTIFNILIEPIKKEFALSDTTMGCSQARSLRSRRPSPSQACGRWHPPSCC
jgi:hypothetical protein